MKTILVLLTFVNTAFAEDNLAVVDKWKTFRSDYGYEFKYPECWKMDYSSFEREGPFEKIKEIFVKRAADCGKPTREGESEPLGVGFNAGWSPIFSEDEYNKIVDEEKAWFKKMEENKLRLARKENRTGDQYSYTVVDWPGQSRKFIRWETILICKTQKIRITGPRIDKPSKSLLDKFAKNDVAIPEPAKTIIESIRCIDPKIPPDPTLKKSKE